MALEIVWRNPLPPTRTNSSIQRVALGDLGAVYAVCSLDANLGVRIDSGRCCLKPGSRAGRGAARGASLVSDRNATRTSRQAPAFP